jgi:hypothetical protein
MIEAARAWVAELSPHVAHLQRTEEWVLELAPDASPALRLAGLTHDMERAYPEGSPRWEPGRGWDDPLYTIAHSERSARVVGDFMRDHGAEEPFVREVVRLILFHETGGFLEADVLQAADSLSFLETMAPVVAGWVVNGTADEAYARDRMRHAVDRIRHDQGREIAAGLLPAALAEVDDIVARARA